MSLPEAVNGGGVSMDQCGGLARGAGGQHGSSHSAVPPPPFVIKTYEMVDDRMTDAIVSWGPACNTFVVWDLYEFSRRLLPKFFKHSNFSSFVRQLNTYVNALAQLHPLAHSLCFVLHAPGVVACPPPPAASAQLSCSRFLRPCTYPSVSPCSFLGVKLPHKHSLRLTCMELSPGSPFPPTCFRLKSSFGGRRGDTQFYVRSLIRRQIHSPFFLFRSRAFAALLSVLPRSNPSRIAPRPRPYPLLRPCAGTQYAQGFRKVNPDRWEFAHEEFVKGQQLRFKNIHRRKPAGVCGPATNPCFASAQQQQTSPQAPQGRATHPLDELERLRKDKVMMMMELGRLGTEYYYAQQEIRAIAERLQATEAHQQQITAFFARTMCPPALLREFQDQNAGEDTKMTTTTTLQQRISHSDAMGRKRARCMASDVAPAADDASGLHRDRRSPSCENEDHPSVSTDGGGGHHHPKLLEINLNVDAAASMCSPELASMDAADSSSLCAAAYDANKQQLLQQQQPLSPTGHCGTPCSSKMELFSSDMNEHVFMVDLNHPLSSTGEWDWQEGQSGHGFEHHGTINHTYFDGMESELFWEHLLGPSTHSVTQQTDHSEMRLVDQLRWPAL